MKKKAQLTLHIDITQEAKDKLDDLQKRSGSASTLEVIRKAIALYDLAITHKSQGSQFFVKENESYQEVEIL